MQRLRVSIVLVVALAASTLPLTAPALAAVAPDAAAHVSTESCTTFLESGTYGLPQEMAYGPLGRLWVTEVAGTRGAVEGIDPAGTTAVRYDLPDSDPFLGGGIVAPDGITVGPDGALWFVGWGTGYDRVGRIDPATSSVDFIDLPAGSHPTHLTTLGADLWITAPGTDALLRLAPPSTVTAHPLAPGSAPDDLAVLGGELWVSERGSGKIARLDASGTLLAEHTVGGDPTLIRAAAGAIWYLKRDASVVGRLDPATGATSEAPTPTPASMPTGLAYDGLGGLWFTESAANRIARVDVASFPAAGSIDETVLTVSSLLPGAVLALPDGTIWFTEHTPFVAHFKPAADGTVLPLPPAVALTVSGPVTTSGGGTVYASSSTFTIGASVSGVCLDTIHYRVYLAGATPGPFVAAAGPAVSFTLPNGPGWVIEFYAVGPGGASLTTLGDPVVVDDTAFPDLVAPVLSVPAPITVPAAGPGGAAVAFEATATDDVDPAPVVDCDRAPGSLFAPGTTTVTCVARDAAGNRSAPGSFTVTVTVPPPVLVAPALVTAAATGTATEVAIPLTATSIVDGSVFTATCAGPEVAAASAQTPGDVLVVVPAGTHVVTCAIGDAHGNTASADVTIRVTSEAPAITVPAPITVDASSPAGAVVTFGASAASVGYGPLAVTCTPGSGSTFPIGVTAVTCAATDPEGRRGEAAFDVTVVRPPCGDALVALSAGGKHTLKIDGGAQVRIVCGGVVVVSGARDALKVDGRATLDAAYVRVGEPFDDPYAALGAPDMSGYPTFRGVDARRGSVVLAPGTYVGGIRVSEKASVSFLPGPYLLAGGGLAITGGTVRGSGVVFYNTGGTRRDGGGDDDDRTRHDDRDRGGGARCGDIRITAGARVALEAPLTGTHAGMLFVQDPACANAVRIGGSATLTTLDGVLYAPSAEVELAGGARLRLRLRIVADTVHVDGRASVVLDFAGP